ncbi:MAG: ABC transporter ATP-binding protein [Nitritalea sp.]
MTSDTLLDIQHLHKGYQGHQALQDVSFQVPEGTVFGLLGPNGAGKTTLIRIINQIITADAGRVLLEGQVLSPKEIRKIGYLPEERGLYKKMVVKEQLLFFARLRGLSSAEAKIRTKDWLERFNLLGWADKKVEELSKGMAQKVQFIATVLHEPRLLILDEPFSGFDPVNADLVLQEILRLKKQGTTIMLSTHRMESVESLCDALAMLHRSRLVLHGTVPEIKARFSQKTYTLSYLPYLSQHSEELANTPQQVLIQGDAREANAQLAEYLQKGLVTSFQPHVPTIEEIFIQQASSQQHDA